MIGPSTTTSLELLRSLSDGKTHDSLFGVLNHTKTVQGERLLRTNILQPPADVETINLRQQVVTELLNSEKMYFTHITVSSP